MWVFRKQHEQNSLTIKSEWICELRHTTEFQRPRLVPKRLEVHRCLKATEVSGLSNAYQATSRRQFVLWKIFYLSILENGSSGFDWLRTQRRICYCSRSWQDLFDSLFGLFGLCFSLYFRDCVLPIPVKNKKKSSPSKKVKATYSDVSTYSTEAQIWVYPDVRAYMYLRNPLTYDHEILYG